jgi:lambda family phage minor tail protein L
MTYSSGDFQGDEFDAVLARQEAHTEVAEEVSSTFYDAVVEMFELDLSVLPGFSGTDHYYFTNFVIPKDAVFVTGGDAYESGEKVKWRRSETSTANQEYEPIPIIATGFDRTTKGQIPQPELQISNIFGTLSGLIASLDDLIGVKVYRRRTLAKYLGNFATKDYDYYFPTDIYYIERKAAETEMSVTFQLASPLDLEGIQLPRRVVTHNHCLWEYRGDECGYSNRRSSDLNGLPIANSFDAVDTDGDLYDSFDSGQQKYLRKLADYLEKKKIRDDAEAAKNLAEGKKNTACDAVTSTAEYFYQFESDDEDDNLDADDSTFALVREDSQGNDSVVTIVFSGQTVAGSQYSSAANRKGNTNNGIAENTITVDAYTYEGAFDTAGSSIKFAIIPENVDAALVFDRNTFSTQSASDIREDEESEGTSIPFGLREVAVTEIEGQANCDTQTDNYNTALAAYNTAQTKFDNALTLLVDTWNGLNSTQQQDLRDRFDVCGKRLTSCQLRFGSANLPYGGFPGANLTRG